MIRRNPEVLWRSTSRGPVVLDPGHESAELLTGVGAAVWELLDDESDVAGLRAAVGGLGLDADAIEGSVAELDRLGLIVVR